MKTDRTPRLSSSSRHKVLTGVPNESESLEREEGGLVAFALCVGVGTLGLALLALLHFLRDGV